MKKIKSILLIVGLISLGGLLFQSTVKADAAPVSCRFNSVPGVTVVVDPIYSSDHSGECTGFVVRDASKKILYQVKNLEPTRGSFIISADGRSVVILQNPIFGNSRGTGQLQLYGKIKQNKNSEMIELVSFFRDGKKMASYTWKDLIIRPQMVEESTSHTRWVYKMLPAKEPLGDIFELETTSLRAYRFEVKTGKLLSADDSADWKRCDIIAYGPIKSEGDGYIMSPAYVAKGEKRAKIRLTEIKVSLNSSYVVACIQDQQGKQVLTDSFPFLLNALTVQ